MARSVSSASVDKKGIDVSDIAVAEKFQEKIREVFCGFENAGRTTSLFVHYHYNVETIKIFIRAERTADFSLHLACIVSHMLDVFAAAGHHHYTKGARLYVQMMLAYEKGQTRRPQSFRASNQKEVMLYGTLVLSGMVFGVIYVSSKPV